VEADRDGRAHIRVDRLGKLEEPPSLTALKELTSRMLPRVHLPELLLEVHAWTGFLGEFTHAAGADARVDQLEVSMAAVLMSEACNFGFRPVTDPDEPALTRARLSHVEQNYLRADTIKAANARLIAAQADLELARLWGGGLVASVDGLRFVVPIATIYAGHNPKYFGRRRGATWINAMNDQRVGIGAQVVPGTARDSLYTLDVMLNPDHGRRPEIVTSDSAGYVVTWTPRAPLLDVGARPGRPAGRFWRCPCRSGSSVAKMVRGESSCLTRSVSRSRSSRGSCGSSPPGTARRTRWCPTPTTCATCGGSSPVVA
jgi:hypothetical protein